MNAIWPSSSELTKAILEVLVKFDGSATVEQLDKEVIDQLNLSSELKSKMRSGNRSEIQYRLAWVRTKAKQKGLITRESPKFWRITLEGRKLT
jgi:restriction system protein